MPSGSTRKQKYEYVPRMHRWAVYEIATGNKVADFATFEEARRETFRLNGWKYKRVEI